MQTGYYANAGGMVTQFNRLDVISNNLANLNTTGFKRDDVVIGDFMRLYQEKRDNLPLQNQTKDGAEFLNRSMVRVPQIVEKYTNFDLGTYARSSNPLDVALTSRDTFFQVKTQSGTKFTRDGAFLLDKDGILVTKNGNPILDTNGMEITIPPDQQVSITNSGIIYAQNPKNLLQKSEIGTIGIVKFDNSKWLNKVGDNLYETNKEAKVTSGDNLMRSGYIEKSNVNAIREMTNLIKTNRLVGMYQKVMDTQMNEMNSDAITKLASIRA